MDRARRFLNAFNKVEEFLRSKTGESERAKFTDVLSAACAGLPEVRPFERQLRNLARLRNAIAHTSTPDALPVADPHDSTVQEMEKIARALLSPPKIGDHFHSAVLFCRPEDKVGDVAGRMLDGTFSQVPVYEDARCIGLLMLETIARWMAASFKENSGMLMEEPVSAVLKLAEQKRTYAILSTSTSVVEALRRFEESSQTGNPIHAIVVTPHGKETEKPEAILTRYDIPRLLEVRGGAE